VGFVPSSSQCVMLQLAECPEINLSEDFAEFMAYEGNGEIEFVKERILQTEAVNAPRAHKVGSFTTISSK